MHALLDLIFDWLVFGFGVPILIGVGFALLADEFKAFQAGRVCFYVAALWIVGKVLMWSVFSSDKFPLRPFVIFLVCGVVGVSLSEALRLTAKRETHDAKPQQDSELVDRLKTSESIAAKVEHTVPITEGPKVLLEYLWKRGRPDEGLTLFNDGTEAALNLEFWDVQRGNWRVKFSPISILKKGERIKVRPAELIELSAPQYTRPYARRNPTFALFLQKLSQDKAIPSSVDPIDVTMNLSYQSASTSDNLRSLNVVSYSRKEQLAQAKFLACGKAEPKP
jgi:hypothetical protein